MKNNAISDITKAQSKLEEIIKSLRTSNWELMPDLYGQLRVTLVTLRGTILKLPEKQKEALENTIKDLRFMEETINIKHKTGLSKNEIKNMGVGLRNCSNNLIELSITLMGKP